MPATDKFVRNLSTMHIVFAISSLVLLVITMWMLAVDHDDPWRGYQQQFAKIEAARIKAAEAKIETEAYDARISELQQELESAKLELMEQQDRIDALTAELKEQDNIVDLQTREVRNQRAFRDVARANYDLGVRDALPETDLAELKGEFDTLQDHVVGLENQLQQAETARNVTQASLNALTKKRDAIEAELKKQRTDVEMLHASLVKVEPDTTLSRFKRTIMQWPIIDGFNSPIKIQQDWIPDLKITLGMASTARFDRCRTCHLAIERVEAGNVPAFPFGKTESDDLETWVEENKYPHPFATHPRPDVYLTASSPHPLTKFGCTGCHDGQGSGTDFANAAHTPNDPNEDHEWREEHDYASNHFWEYPMFPKRFRESACIKCHHNVVELGVNDKFGSTAPKAYEGWQLIREYGCFGCHEINGYDGDKRIGPDIRLEPSTPAERVRVAADPTIIGGDMRKVGPSLRHVGSKTTKEWIAYWTEEPKRFRPSTRMPQFFDLSNQQDPHAQKLQPVEIAAISQYLIDKSEPLEVMSPKEGYVPDAERGLEAFRQRGCLACHQHEGIEGLTQSFGPDLSKVHSKIQPGQSGFNWVYTWIREPERHHPRTKMPNLFLAPEGEGDNYVDPAADIAAFLLQKGPGKYEMPKVDNAALDELTKLFLSKAITTEQTELTMQSRRYPVAKELIKGDEIELAQGTDEERADDATWKRIKMNYVGRRTISRYGCYGCHDIPGFEDARPIGTALQDWGRKDTSRLALEHIEEFLHHHGEPADSQFHSTHERVEVALKKARAGEFPNQEVADRELSAAYFYESLSHHGRPGFFWQKLRYPRSYDYEKIGTKNYDERLRMPKFPFNEEQIEAVATFVLGLVAEPPAEEYVFTPTGPELDKIQGEQLLQKYNCAGCHMLDMPEIQYGIDPEDVFATEMQPADHPEARDLLLQLKPPRKAYTGHTMQVTEDDETIELPVLGFRGLIYAKPDPEDDLEDQEYAYDLWETLDADGKEVLPGARMLVPATRLVSQKPARGGDFAEWLVEQLIEGPADNNRFLAWQMAPPPLYLEGTKVQTPWLYNFLKEPYQLRHTTVLRMPRFNMDDHEAQTLANYFAAHDGVPYPYQDIEPRDPEYLADRNESFHSEFPDKENSYLKESWQLLNAPLCIKCHSVGGRAFQATDPKKDIRGPNLEHVVDRLRPDWTLLWLYNPRWITPYTSMPAVFPKNSQQFDDLFGGQGREQTIAVRDALMNYHRLMEQIGRYVPPKASAGDQTGE